MKKVLIVIAALLILALMLTACGEKKKDNSSSKTDTTVVVDGTTPADQSNTASDEKPAFSVETKYGDLKYPVKWQDQIETSVSDEDVYTVTFSLKDGTELFALHFGGGEGYLLGTLTENGESIPVYVDEKDLDASGKDFDTYAEMQEDVNVILQHLISDYDFSAGTGSTGGNTAVSSEPTGEYEIKTSFATLYYPNKWKDKVKVEEKDNAVVFYSDDVELFELQFGGTDGFSVGTYDGKDLRYVTFDFAEFKSDSDRFEELCAMQEDANVIIDNLGKDEKFTAK